jgi:hypothetical protein
MVSLKEIEASLKRAKLIKTLNAHNEKRKQDMSDLVRAGTGRASKSTQTTTREKKDTYFRFGGVQEAVNKMFGVPEPANPRLYKLAKFVRRKLVKK